MYNSKGDLICIHDFRDGVCCKCFAPRTPGDQLKAERALELHEWRIKQGQKIIDQDIF